MINSDTKPILVISKTRPNPTIHFASNDRGSTMPYCQHGQRRSLADSAAFQARFAPTTNGLMNCTGCAEQIYQHPTWAKNHHPMMEPSLRYI